MSSPIIWILFPGLAAVILFALQRKRVITLILGTLVSLVLAFLAWVAPFGETVQIASLSFQLDDSLVILGRRFSIDGNDQYALMLIYLGVAFWFIGAGTARAHPLFVSGALGIAALLTSVLAVETFLYAALLIELMVLVSVPLLSPPDKPTGPGVLRYLTLQTLGFPFILFTGWLLAGVEAGLPDSQNIQLASILLGLGFAFLLGIFPFHSWIPMLSAESPPYIIAFLFYELPLAILLFALNFIHQYPWLRFNSDVYLLLTLTGTMMLMIGGAGAAFQRHLGRMMGFAVMVEIGLSLLAIGVGLGPDGNGTSLGLFFALLLPRGVSLGVWALALIVLQRGLSEGDANRSDPQKNDLSFRNVQGIARRYPVAGLALLLAHFSLAGLPMLAGFPIRLALLEKLVQQSLLMTSICLVGYLGLILGGIRVTAVLVMGKDEAAWKANEGWGEKALLVAGSLMLILIGILPQWFTPLMVQMADIFSRSHQ